MLSHRRHRRFNDRTSAAGANPPTSHALANVAPSIDPGQADRGSTTPILSLRCTSWRQVLVVTATGELTGETAHQLHATLESSPQDADCVVLDLRGLARIDRAGREAITRAGADSGARGRELLLVRPSSRLVSWRRPPGMAGARGPSFVDDLVEAFQWAAGTRTSQEEVSHVGH